MASTTSLTIGFDTAQRALIDELAVTAFNLDPSATADDIENAIQAWAAPLLVGALVAEVETVKIPEVTAQMQANPGTAAMFAEAENIRRQNLDQRIRELFPQPDPDPIDIEPGVVVGEPGADRRPG